MNRSSRVRWIGVAVGVASGMVLAAGPASATPLSTSFGCIAQGAHVLECFATTTGGVPPYTYHWNVSPSPNATITFICGSGSGTTLVHVLETVTDSVGASTSADRTATCLGGPPH